MPNPARLKGDRNERYLVKLLQLAGFSATRTPKSGGIYPRGPLSGFDISLPLHGRVYKVEAKHHGSSFKRIYNWLRPVDILIARADRSDPLVILPLRLAIQIVEAAVSNHKTKDNK